MLNKILTLALAAISTEALKLNAHEMTGVRGSTCTEDSDCGYTLFCDAGVCADDDYSDGFGGLFGSLAQVDHSIAGGEGTGTPQEALPELSVELVADDELAQIEADSGWVYKTEGESCTKPNERCTLYTSCVDGRCCHDWLGCMSLAQVEHPIAGGEGTGTPQEALPELSVELPLFDNELAQVDHPIAGGEGTGTPQEALPELSVELVADDELAQIKAYSESGLDLLEDEYCSNKKEGATCGYYMSCQSGKCCHDWFGCLSLAQVDQPIAGGEGTGTPQEALPELSVELVSDDELAQVDTNAEWRRGPNAHTNTCDYSFACLFQRKCKPCPE